MPVKLLPLTFRECIETGVYVDAWKKSNIIAVRTKGNKKIGNNYRPVSVTNVQ